MTAVGCPSEAQQLLESRFLAALQAATRYEFSADQRELILHDTRANELRFSRSRT